MKTIYGLACVTSLALLSGCGGGSTTTGPTKTADSFLAGTWAGTVTIQRAGMPDTIAPTEWVFAPMPKTGGAGYQATATIRDGWLPVTVTMTTSAIPPAPGATVRSSGNYDSPRGCKGIFGSDGTATADRFTGTIDGVDCLQLPAPSTFRGTVTLSKSR